MPATVDVPVFEQNRLLGQLTTSEYTRLAADLEPVELSAGQFLALPDQAVGRIYFLRTAVVSLLVPMEDGSGVEGATVGNEGIVGLESHLGDGVAHFEMRVQVSGLAARIDASAYRDAVRRSPCLQMLVHRYALALMYQIARTSGCNRVHSVGERVARVLLMTADRAGREILPLTHEVLATMLGIRRASVSQAAAALQRAGLIDYRRGSLTIVDRAGLEAAACEDYRLTRKAYDHLVW
jgi:CRP-like cAMP-binding protein